MHNSAEKIIAVPKKVTNGNIPPADRIASFKLPFENPKSLAGA